MRKCTYREDVSPESPDHGLEIVGYALKLRQSHLLPAGATPESQAAQAEVWTAGTAYAALTRPRQDRR